jgi:hypothetical protein
MRQTRALYESCSKLLLRPTMVKSRATVISQKITDSNRRLELEIRLRNTDDGKPVIATKVFDSLWLRFNCHSDKSKQADSGQRIIDYAKIPSDLKIKRCIYDEHNVYIEWQEPGVTQSVIPIGLLVGAVDYKQTRAKIDIDKYSTKTLKTFDYNHFVDSATAGDRQPSVSGLFVHEWMKHVYLYGFALVKNVPCKVDNVQNLAQLICPVQTTIYGKLFDVEATPNPINIAYSTHALDYHQDLIYYESAPGIQLLHCLKNDRCVQGGESLLLDVFKAASDFRAQYADHFRILSTVPATFQKIHFNRQRPVYMVYQKEHICLNRNADIVSVNWAPAFEGPLSLSITADTIRKYYQSYLVFTRFLANHPYNVHFLLEPGDCLVFNNSNNIVLTVDFHFPCTLTLNSCFDDRLYRTHTAWQKRISTEQRVSTLAR